MRFCCFLLSFCQKLFDNCTDFLPRRSLVNAVFFVQRKRHDGDMVFHTKRYRGRVHNLQTVLDDVKVSDFVVLFGVVIFLRIAVVNAVDIFGLQQYVRQNLRRSERRARVGAEIRVARTARHDDDATFFKVADRTA